MKRWLIRLQCWWLVQRIEWSNAWREIVRFKR
jgi:hypothetical protein